MVFYTLNGTPKAQNNSIDRFLLDLNDSVPILLFSKMVKHNSLDSSRLPFDQNFLQHPTSGGSHSFGGDDRLDPGRRPFILGAPG